jgi:hypothetical protein
MDWSVVPELVGLAPRAAVRDPVISSADSARIKPMRISMHDQFLGGVAASRNAAVDASQPRLVVDG